MENPYNQTEHVNPQPSNQQNGSRNFHREDNVIYRSCANNQQSSNNTISIAIICGTILIMFSIGYYFFSKVSDSADKLITNITDNTSEIHKNSNKIISETMNSSKKMRDDFGKSHNQMQKDFEKRRRQSKKWIDSNDSLNNSALLEQAKKKLQEQQAEAQQVIDSLPYNKQSQELLEKFAP